jgi:hypothetical protein
MSAPAGPAACPECARYRKALALILALIARMAGGMAAEVRATAQEALAPDGAGKEQP